MKIRGKGTLARWIAGTTMAVGFAAASLVAGAQDAQVLRLGEARFDVPEFTGYEVEYTSAFGRFFNQVRPVEMAGVPKISVLNLIDMPGSVIVDSKVIDRRTLRMEHMSSPFFAWGQEFLVARADATGFEFVRIPLAGGAPIHAKGTAEYGGYVDDLGFSPTLAAVMPRPVGFRFRLPAMQPKTDGTMASVLIEYHVTGRETLSLASGVRCECWVIDQTDSAGGLHRFWVSREAPFLIKRHRDVGGPRDFVSEVLSFKSY